MAVVKGQMQRAFNMTLESIGGAVLSFLKALATPLQMIWSAMIEGLKRRRYPCQYLLVATVLENIQTDPRLACLLDIPEGGRQLTMQEWFGILSFVREHNLWFPWEIYFDDEDGGPFVQLDVTKRFFKFSLCNVTVVLWRRRDLFTDQVLELVFSKLIVEPVIATRKDVRDLLGLDKYGQPQESYADHDEDSQN